MPDLAELQRAIVAERRSRGFTTDPLQVSTLLVEEVGEVARELERAAGGSTEVDEVTFADGSYGPHHGRLVERRRRTDLPVVGRTLFVRHADATIAITCTAMGTDMASVEDDLTDAESVAATIQLA